ncbi:MAG TPA: DUF6516 family protein [Xanthobacteraceae bacterium]
MPADAARPHGIAYSLTLHEPGGRRVFGVDNAHLVRSTRGPGGRSAARRDHLHRGEAVRTYVYRDADTLMDHFWREVVAIVNKAGEE